MSRWRRSIPTCVGNTSGSLGVLFCFAVHPHVRGEYLPEVDRLPSILGPSPRAWGIRRCICRAVASCTVHPHVRGEYPGPPARSPWHYGPSPRAWGILAKRGSRVTIVGPSPRAWGILMPAHVAEPALRSIPTCVGNTSVVGLRRASPAGPSPRAWGIRAKSPVPSKVHRSIPTCVGNTLDRLETLGKLMVHPHVRGEYSGLRRT